MALETAAVALMAEDLRLVPDALRLGRAARRVIRQNVVASLAVKGAVLALTLAGLGSLWASVGADMGASLLVIGNGLRLLRWRPLSDVGASGSVWASTAGALEMNPRPPG